MSLTLASSSRLFAQPSGLTLPGVEGVLGMLEVQTLPGSPIGLACPAHATDLLGLPCAG